MLACRPIAVISAAAIDTRRFTVSLLAFSQANCGQRLRRSKTQTTAAEMAIWWLMVTSGGIGVGRRYRKRGADLNTTGRSKAAGLCWRKPAVVPPGKPATGVGPIDAIMI